MAVGLETEWGHLSPCWAVYVRCFSEVRPSTGLLTHSFWCEQTAWEAGSWFRKPMSCMNPRTAKTSWAINKDWALQGDLYSSQNLGDGSFWCFGGPYFVWWPQPFSSPSLAGKTSTPIKVFLVPAQPIAQLVRAVLELAGARATVATAVHTATERPRRSSEEGKGQLVWDAKRMFGATKQI